MYSRLRFPCPLLPQSLDVTLIPDFKAWICKEPGDFVEWPLYNGLKLFLWVIHDYYHIENEYTR
jgi:hypothetical protein